MVNLLAAEEQLAAAEEAMNRGEPPLLMGMTCSTVAISSGRCPLGKLPKIMVVPQ